MIFSLWGSCINQAKDGMVQHMWIAWHGRNSGRAGHKFRGRPVTGISICCTWLGLSAEAQKETEEAQKETELPSASVEAEMPSVDLLQSMSNGEDLQTLARTASAVPQKPARSTRFTLHPPSLSTKMPFEEPSFPQLAVPATVPRRGASRPTIGLGIKERRNRSGRGEREEGRGDRGERMGLSGSLDIAMPAKVCQQVIS